MVNDYGKRIIAQYGLRASHFECGPGWHDLIESLVADLIAMGWDRRAEQIKSKLGGLRFYVGVATDPMLDRITEAESASYRVCESCGQPGSRKGSGWIRTACEAH